MCGRNEYVYISVGVEYMVKNRNVIIERGKVKAWELVWRKLDKYMDVSATGTANVKGVYMRDIVAVQQCM